MCRWSQVMSALKAAQNHAQLLSSHPLETAALRTQIGHLTRDLREVQEERQQLLGRLQESEDSGQGILAKLRQEAGCLEVKVHSLEAQNAALKHKLDETTQQLQEVTLTADHLRESMRVMQTDRIAEAASQNERVATIQRLQSMQVEGKLELKRAHDKLRDQVLLVPTFASARARLT